MPREHEPGRDRRGSEPWVPRTPVPLPPELAAFLRDQDLVALLNGSDHGTVLIVKAPGATIDGLPARVPIDLQHELYACPTAPVIRLLLTIADHPARPLRFESFINVADPGQHADYAALSQQAELLLLCYDEHLHHRRSKRVPLGAPGLVAGVLARALQLAHAIPSTHYDFDRAKASVQEATRL